MSEPINESITPAIGWGVLHLFCKPTPSFEPEGVVRAVKAAEAASHQVVCANLLGHKADFCVMALGPDWRELRRLQAGLQAAGAEIVDSYVSLTEVSEYAKGAPEAMLQARLYPQLPPEGKPAFCFYPMSKRRWPEANWYALPYEERHALMQEHGVSGRKFAGRIVQLITASTGLDEHEWGVTLFGEHPDDLKDVVYTLRFDRASAIYAEFGHFYVGIVTTPDALGSA